MSTRRRRRRKQGGDPLPIMLAVLAIIVIGLAVHFWVITLGTIAISTAGYVTYRRHVPRKAKRNEVTYHAEMTPEQKARTRERQRAKVIDLGPNATATDKRMFNRDNPAPGPAVPPENDTPPF
jgi:hypothetical protein